MFAVYQKKFARNVHEINSNLKCSFSNLQSKQHLFLVVVVGFLVVVLLVFVLVVFFHVVMVGLVIIVFAVCCKCRGTGSTGAGGRGQASKI
jgi:hypothetical protein